MRTPRYLDKELSEKTQELFLEVAKFVIKMVFEPTEAVFFKQKLLEVISEVLGKGRFLVGTRKKWDFEIRFIADRGRMKIVEREGGREHYYLAFKRNFSRGKIKTFYSVSLQAILMLLREIFAYLLQKDGFLLHASSCLSQKGKLKIFLAPQGGGKTTVADLLSKTKGFVKFSDDILLIRKRKGRWHFFSPPFVEKEMLPTKRKAKDAKIFFVKKSKVPSKKKLDNKDKVLRLILKQIWVRTEKLEKQTLANVMSFVTENEFHQLKSTFDAKQMREVLK